MSGEWLMRITGSVVPICLLIAVVECAVDDSEHIDGLGMLCGVVTAAALIRSLIEFLRTLIH